MSGIFQFLEHQPFFALFAVVALGMWLGRQKLGGIALGSVVGVILVGILMSMWAYRSSGVSLELPALLETVFFNLFIFSMGVKIGPQFFAGLQRDGWHLVFIGTIVVIVSPLLAWVLGAAFHWPQGTVPGMLAGSNNSSATFGAALAALQSPTFQPAEGNSRELAIASLSAAFALCYALAQVQFVLLWRLWPKLAGFDAPAAAQKFEESIGHGRTAPLPGTAEAGDWVDVSIAIRAYRVAAGNIGGVTIGELRARAPGGSIETVRRADQWLAPDDNLVLEPGDEVVVSAPIAGQVRAREALGPEIPDPEARSRTPVHTVDVVISRPQAVGRPFRDLRALVGGGLYANALFRAGEELPPDPGTVAKFGDVVRVTGTEPRIAELEKQVGHVIRSSHASDILTLAIGLLVGSALGAIPVPVGGASITFGSAAVLVTGILFGWLKTRHPALGGPISEGGRTLMEELGLNVFTAVLAVNSGKAVLQVMDGGPVLSLIIGSMLVSAVPPIVAWWIGRHVLRMNASLLMGAVSGARQNTSSMQAAQELSRSAVPGIGYPVPLAITTVGMSIIAYFFALLA